MSHHQRQVATPAKRAISILLSMLMCAESGIAFAQYTGPGAIPISNTPVGVGLTGAKPNFLVTLDDSGSTNWEFMPGERQEWRHNFAGMYSRACNTIYFDPDGQYPLPPDPSDVSKTLDRPIGSELPLDGFVYTQVVSAAIDKSVYANLPNVFFIQ